MVIIFLWHLFGKMWQNWGNSKRAKTTHKEKILMYYFSYIGKELELKSNGFPGVVHTLT